MNIIRTDLENLENTKRVYLKDFYVKTKCPKCGEWLRRQVSELEYPQVTESGDPHGYETVYFECGACDLSEIERSFKITKVEATIEMDIRMLKDWDMGREINVNE
jgi:predicted RNA-binding Zn-ribbon protein involved in translation (DUF1610 family)